MDVEALDVRSSLITSKARNLKIYDGMGNWIKSVYGSPKQGALLFLCFVPFANGTGT